MSSYHFNGGEFGDRHTSDDSWDYPPPTPGGEFETADSHEAEYPHEDAWPEAGFSAWSPSEWGSPMEAIHWEQGYPETMAYPPAEETFAYQQHLRAAPAMSEASQFRVSQHPVSTSMRPAVPANPLKVVCVGPTFRVGGVRQHALALAKFLNPERVQIKEFVVTEQAASAGRRDSRMPAPVTPASTSTIQRVSEASDILLMWGAGYNGRIPAGRAVRVFLAHGESWWTRNALEESSRVIDHVIAVSDQVRRSICNGFPTTTILNGVDTARLGQTAAREDLRRRFAFSEGDFVVGSIGRFTREKQFHLLIESLTRLPERFKLLLVGSGRRQAELLDFANRHIPGRFAMVSANDYLGDFYSAMDAFALVSAHEGFGLVLAEAMMCGRPVVSTRVGCASEVIHDRVNGLLVDHHPDSIASAFRLLQEHPHWAKGLAAEGHHFANTHLHAARMAREYEDLLLRLHGDRENRRRSGQ